MVGYSQTNLEAKEEKAKKEADNRAQPSPSIASSSNTPLQASLKKSDDYSILKNNVNTMDVATRVYAYQLSTKMIGTLSENANYNGIVQRISQEKSVLAPHFPPVANDRISYDKSLESWCQKYPNELQSFLSLLNEIYAKNHTQK